MTRAFRIMASLGLVMGFAAAGQMWSRLANEDEATREFVDALGVPVGAIDPALLDSGASVGLLLLGAWLAGKLAAYISIPRVSGYLLFGVLVGPSCLGLITAPEIPYLGLVNSLAITLIALTAGGEIRLEFLRRSAKTIGLILAFEMPLVFIAVTGLMMPIGPPLGLADRSQAVVLLALGAVVATIAVANSPAVVIAILTETHARGVMAQTALATTVCKDLALVVLFAVTMTVAGATLARAGLLTPAGEAHVAGVAEEAESHPAEENVEAEGVGAHADVPLWLTLVQHLGGSLLAGVVVGLGMAWYLHNIHEHLPIFLVLSCFGIALVSQALGLEALIVAIVAGMLMQNAWAERSQGFFEAVEDLSLPVYCVFFAVAGAKVDLAVAATMWPWALTLVGVRLFVVWGSTTLGATLAGVERPARAWLWTALVPQAGVSLALATIVAASIKGEHGEILFNLLLTMIAIHELAGPLLFKHGLVKAGEVEANGQTRE